MQEDTKEAGSSAKAAVSISPHDGNEPESNAEFTQELRQWFNDLTAEDKATALAFAGGRVFSFLSMERSSLSQCGGDGSAVDENVVPTTDVPVVAGEVDWGALVPLESVTGSGGFPCRESPLSAGKATVSATNPNGQMPEAQSDDVTDKVENSDDVSAEVDQKKVNKVEATISPSDEFRIESGTNEPSDSNPSNPNALEEDPAVVEATIASDDDDDDKIIGVDAASSNKPTPKSVPVGAAIPVHIAQLLGEICVIFPSTFSLVGDIKTKEKDSLITIHPSYLNKTNGDNLVSILADAAASIPSGDVDIEVIPKDTNHGDPAEAKKGDFAGTEQTAAPAAEEHTPPNENLSRALEGAGNDSSIANEAGSPDTLISHKPGSPEAVSVQPAGDARVCLPFYVALLSRFSTSLVSAFHRSDVAQGAVQDATQPALEKPGDTTVEAEEVQVHSSEKGRQDIILQAKTEAGDVKVGSGGADDSIEMSLPRLLPLLFAKLETLPLIEAEESGRIIPPLAGLELTNTTKMGVLLTPALRDVLLYLVRSDLKIQTSLLDIDDRTSKIVQSKAQTDNTMEDAPEGTTPPSNEAETVEAVKPSVGALSTDAAPADSAATVLSSATADEASTNAPSVVTNKRNNKKKKKKKKRKGGQPGGRQAPSTTSTTSAPTTTTKTPTTLPPAETRNELNEQSQDSNSDGRQEKGTQKEKSETEKLDMKVEESAPISKPVQSTPPPPAPTTRKAETPTAEEPKEAVSNASTEVAKPEAGVPEANDASGTDEKGKGENQDGLHVSRVEGVGTTCVVVSQNPEPKKDVEKTKSVSTSGATENIEHPKDDNSVWETVEVRSRGNRKKASERNNQGGRFSQLVSNSSSTNGGHGNGPKKSKAPRTNASRKRVTARKVAREILSSVLDAVDDEVRRRRQTWREPARQTGNRWASAKGKTGGLASRLAAGGDGSSSSKAVAQDATMRDVLMGRHANRQQGNKGAKAHPGNSPPANNRMYADRVRQRQDTRADSKSALNRQVPDNKKNRDKVDRASGGVAGKGVLTQVADQNTAATVPETLSAVSTNSAYTETPSARNPPPQRKVARDDSSSAESGEATKVQATSSHNEKDGSPSPPLPTLLSPGNANSATSSVASSLDAPHIGHHGNHHSYYTSSENDVGCHLLHICDRLTRDISHFMKRRDIALTARRRERGLVLGALQESLSLLWPGMCSVEMYGSCATQLDLPSSDLDVVICGLDRPMEPIPPQPSNASMNSPQNQTPSESYDHEVEEWHPSQQLHVPHDAHMYQQTNRSPIPHGHVPMMYGHLSLNGERVLRLAMELERQPWAVHVKAIPTAKVPVIKILADPARLQSAVVSGNSEWMMQHQGASQTQLLKTDMAADEGGNDLPGAKSGQVPSYPSAQTLPPWRGADVVNGLLKLDITFEGPEHGGIGSTKFSSRVVEDFSTESGLSPESTPAVQVLMVLKELLAQRRLNEPFSGGLSSYALLLLVVSVIRERSIIRAELERVECQRRMVAADEGHPPVRMSQPEPNTVQTSGPGRARDRGRHEKKQHPAAKAKRGKGSSPHADERRYRPDKSDKDAEDTAPHSKDASKKTGAETVASSSSDKTPIQSSTNSGVEKKGGSKAPSLSTSSKNASSSWASVARKSAQPSSRNPQGQEATPKAPPAEKKTSQSKKPAGAINSFAAAVAKGTANGPAINPPSTQATNTPSASSQPQPEADKGRQRRPGQPAVAEATPERKEKDKRRENPKNSPATKPPASNATSATAENSVGGASVGKTYASNPYDSTMAESPSLFPQGFHDVIEVLCSGETTAGKLLMHFLLFYGQHFDSQSTAIDYSGKHHRDLQGGNNGYSLMSPYLLRRTAGSYDPMTGMLTVDPIVVYDPLEGRENNNVSRSCFAWSSVRWVFAQSYMTLSSAVEMNAGHATAHEHSAGNRGVQTQMIHSHATTNISTDTTAATTTTAPHDSSLRGNSNSWQGPYVHDQSGNIMVDPSSPLLELLLSF